MKHGASGSGGFTLLEVIVVLAVVATLAALLTPMVFSYIDDANRAKAANDATVIAASIAKMFSDTGKLPFKKNGPGPNAKETDDADLLLTGDGGAIPAASDTTGGTWTGAGLKTDTIENQLITNTPTPGGSAGTAYSTTGRNAWKGPYLDTPKADPWGNKFYVNIGKGDPAGTPKAVIVISAGPNGKLETSADQLVATALVASGDDIIARVK